jgi:acetate kinase
VEAVNAILAVNCGSSSLKFGLYDAQSEAPRLLCEGEAEEIGGANGSFDFKVADGAKAPVSEQRSFADHEAALNFALDELKRRDFPVPNAAGHRIVHGGPKLREHQRLSPLMLDQIRAAAAFAPLHLPTAIKSIEAVTKRLPDVPQVVCFDTAFHRTLPDVSRFFALPRALADQGVFRYGFHGLSIESILATLDPIPQRLVIAHLGNGCSITAIRNGESIDTTMGLTPTGGFIMGTRTGDLDPGVLLYLLRTGAYRDEQLEHLVDKESGLLGVSGISSDVRTLLKVRDGDSHARLALEMFCYQVSQSVAGMMVALGGLDALVFAGGIGENAASLREEICARLACIGLGAEKVRVVKSNEDLRIAVVTSDLL